MTHFLRVPSPFVYSNEFGYCPNANCCATSKPRSFYTWFLLVLGFGLVCVGTTAPKYGPRTAILGVVQSHRTLDMQQLRNIHRSTRPSPWRTRGVGHAFSALQECTKRPQSAQCPGDFARGPSAPLDKAYMNLSDGKSVTSSMGLAKMCVIATMVTVIVRCGMGRLRAVQAASGEPCVAAYKSISTTRCAFRVCATHSFLLIVLRFWLVISVHHPRLEQVKF